MEEVKEILAPASNGMLIAIIILLLMFIVLLISTLFKRHKQGEDEEKIDWRETKKVVSDLVTVSKVHELRLTTIEKALDDHDYEFRLLRGGPIVEQEPIRKRK